MNFKDLLNAPLPSKSGAVQEASDDLLNTTDPKVPEFKGVEQDYPDDGDMTPGRCPNNSDVKAKEPPTIHPPLETPKDVSEDGVAGDPGVPMPPMADPVMPTANPAPVDSPEGDTALSPDESQRVDDKMNAIATPMLLADELDECDMKEFVESTDCDIAIAEGFLTERTIVKFDKNAKRAQLYEVAVRSIAQEKNDPLWRKLETVYKMERILKAKLRKKYHSQANAKVKEYLARAKKSKSGILSRIAAKIMGK